MADQTLLVWISIEGGERCQGENGGSNYANDNTLRLVHCKVFVLVVISEMDGYVMMLKHTKSIRCHLCQLLLDGLRDNIPSSTFPCLAISPVPGMLTHLPVCG